MRRPGVSSDMIAAALSFARAHAAQYLEDLRTFLRFASVSGPKHYASERTRCAAWLARHLQRIGLDDVRLMGDSGAPIVVGRSRRRRRAMHVWLYGHYDVQPPGYIRRWRWPPFSAHVESGQLFGRGASDNKGQLLAHVSAAQAFLETSDLPVNLTCVFEGEEEIGSPGLRRELPRLLSSPVDVVLISDTPMFDDLTPTIATALRGSLSLEVRLSAGVKDLHSGLYGGTVRDAAFSAALVSASLFDPSGRVAIPGFYDDVPLPSEAVRAQLRTLDSSGRDLLRLTGRTEWGEPSFTPRERVSLRPALTLTGIAAGHTSEGTMAVIPSTAIVKLNARLVSPQAPDTIERLVRLHVADVVPRGIEWSVVRQAAAHPVSITLPERVLNAAATASRQAFGRTPVFLPSGGTIPVVEQLQRQGIPALLYGLARPNDRAHGVDERFSISHYARCTAASVVLLAELARGAAGSSATYAEAS